MSNQALLLDTHVFLWWRSADRRLTKQVREAIATADLVYVSAASAWEAGIKIALGRLRLPEDLERGVEKSGFVKLPITFAHAEIATSLPLHHTDPFDRMLIAQALAEGLALVTHDRRFEAYEAQFLWT